MASNYINIAPANLFLKVGETKQLQIDCDFPNDSWVLQVEPEGVVSVDKLTREITGVKIGHATIKLVLDHRNLADGTRIQDTESIVVEVEEGDKIATPVKIMLHNRQTNRLVTMVGDITDTEEVIKIPNTNGTLLTEEQVEDTQYVIAKPSITNVTPYEPNFKKEFEGSQFMVRLGALKETHKSSEWQFALDSDFNSIIKTVKHETGDLTKCGHELFGITCYVRVRYNSESYMSPWSDGVKVTMTSDTPADSLRTPLKGNDNFEGCYYGEITKDQQVDNYDYRGTYNTLFQYNLKDFKVGWQVEHNGKLYYAKQVLNASNAATPGTDDTKWALDTRENLPTIRLLMDMVGVGLGLADNNVDGYSTGSTQLGALRKQDISWSKFMKHGRLIYVATEPIAGTICWNDIAKREAAYGERTIRYGTRLYRVRMLKQEEYEKFMREFCVGDDVYANKMQRQDNELIEDFQEGANRNCYKFVEGDWRMVTVDPKSRTCFYRPVLELIATGSEPWRHWDAGAIADGENFRYDKFTDTGYFGVVPDSKLISGANLCTMIGLTAGSPINDGCGWLKFYWHGMVVYISKKSVRYNLTWKEMNNAKAHYPMDGQHELIKDNTKYIVTSPMATRAQPYVFDNFDLNHTPTYFHAGNIAMDMAKYSMQQELIYRIQNGYVDGGTSDTVEWHKFAGTYKFWHGGLQKGDNWENFTSREQINLVAGSGSLGNGPYGRECTANRDANGNSNCWGQFGAAGWNGNHSINYRDTDNGYMPCLIIRNFNK